MGQPKPGQGGSGGQFDNGARTAMRDLYARFVLTLIGPALALKARREYERWRAVQHAAAIARDQQIKARCARWQAERASRPSREPDDAVDHWVRVYENALGVDPELIVPGEQVALIRQQRAEQQQAQQRAEMLGQGADAAAKLGSVDTSKKNALTDVTQAFSGYA